MSAIRIAILSRQFDAGYFAQLLPQIDFVLYRDADTLANNHQLLWLSDELAPGDPLLALAKQHPTLVCSTLYSLQELSLQHDNVARLSGWSSVWPQPVWEMAAGSATDRQDFTKIVEAFSKQVIWVPDITGLIAPRTIAKIINEAVYVQADGISNAADIDIAMQLGTNYPHGPFEWAKLIGEKPIAALLHKLQMDGEAVEIHPSLNTYNGI